MKQKFLYTCSFFFLFALLLTYGALMQSHTSTEYDEGVYLTTFLLANKGYSLYTQTFFSQFPAFFALVNPFFLLGGQTLEAARMGIFILSLLGSASFFWLGREVGELAFPFFAIGLLYLIPIFTREITTFHADSIPGSFSLLTFVAFFMLQKTQKTYWIVIGIFFLSIALLTKVDIFLMPSILIFSAQFVRKSHTTQKIRIKEFLLAVGTLLTTFLLFLSFFGMQSLTTTMQFRLQTSAKSPFLPLQFFMFFGQNPILIVLLICGIILGSIALIKKIGNVTLLVSLFAWIFTTIFLLIPYRPLQTHHIIFLCIPTVMLFSYSLIRIARRFFSSGQLTIFSVVFALCILLFSIQNALKIPKNLLTSEEMEGVKIIQEKTNPMDFVVSDDGLLTGVSKRLVPPNLSDISYERLGSGNLSSAVFEKEIAMYKPKLILSWNGRIDSLPNISTILMRNQYLLLTDKPRKVYIRSN